MYIYLYLYLYTFTVEKCSIYLHYIDTYKHKIHESSPRMPYPPWRGPRVLARCWATTLSVHCYILSSIQSPAGLLRLCYPMCYLICHPTFTIYALLGAIYVFSYVLSSVLPYMPSYDYVCYSRYCSVNSTMYYPRYSICSLSYVPSYFSPPHPTPHHLDGSPGLSNNKAPGIWQGQACSLEVLQGGFQRQGQCSLPCLGEWGGQWKWDHTAISSNSYNSYIHHIYYIYFMHIVLVMYVTLSLSICSYIMYTYIYIYMDIHLVYSTLGPPRRLNRGSNVSLSGDPSSSWVPQWDLWARAQGDFFGNRLGLLCNSFLPNFYWYRNLF